LETEKWQIAKAILSKKSNVGSITISDLKLYYRAIAINTLLAQKQIRRPVEQNKIEDPNTNSCSYTHLIFDKGTKNMNVEKTASSTNVAGKSGYLPAVN
jgi:hypothetical protein